MRIEWKAENVAKAYKKKPQRRQPLRNEKILITKGVYHIGPKTSKHL